MQAIVLADGDVGARDALDAAWPGWLEAGAIVIAADGGARHAEPLGLDLDLWVGDGDSLGGAGLADLRAGAVPMELAPAAKDESDTELAVRAAVRRGATRIVLLGALGGPRLDHALANIGLLADPALRGVPTCLLHPNARVMLLSAPGADGGPVTHILPGPIGGLVSLLPQGDGVVGVTTHGLVFPLDDEPLPAGPARGLSNVRAAEDARVSVRSGRLLVFEAPDTLSP
jgi:thiamine pyrophosphokinase